MTVNFNSILQAVVVALLLWVGNTVLEVDKDNAVQAQQITEIRRMIDSRTVWYDSANGRIIILEKNVENIQEQIQKMYPVEDMYYHLGNRKE